MWLEKLGLKKEKSKKEIALQIEEERKYLINNQSDFFVLEAYKALRTNVTFSLTGEHHCKVMAMTSSFQSEGKSTTATNLALSWAAAEKKVLLIDCDLRRPKLARLLNLKCSVGLSNVIMDNTLLDKAIIPSGTPHMDVILAGDIPPNPSELLGSRRMGKIVEQMRERYDFIILDTPPINMVTDTAVLSPFTDGILFVVRAGNADRNSVRHALDQLSYLHVKVLGFILNGVDMEKTSYGGYRHRYRYENAYGYVQNNLGEASK